MLHLQLSLLKLARDSDRGIDHTGEISEYQIAQGNRSSVRLKSVLPVLVDIQSV